MARKVKLWQDKEETAQDTVSEAHRAEFHKKIANIKKLQGIKCEEDECDEEKRCDEKLIPSTEKYVILLKYEKDENLTVPKGDILLSWIKYRLQKRYRQTKAHLSTPHWNSSKRLLSLRDFYIPPTFLSYELGPPPTELGLHDLFNQGSSKTILVVGNSGYGKSALCTKIAFDWASLRYSHYLSRFHLLFVVSLNQIGFKSLDEVILDNITLEINKTKTPLVLELPGVSEKLKTIKLTEKDIISLLNEAQERTLIVLDGYDHSKVHQKVLDRIFKPPDGNTGLSFSKTTVLITAQPFASASVFSRFTKRVFLRNFREAEKAHFSCLYFPKDETKQNLVNKYTSHSSPFTLQLLCLYYEAADTRTKEVKNINDAYRYYLSFALQSAVADSDALQTKDQEIDEMLHVVGNFLWRRPSHYSCSSIHLLKPNSHVAKMLKNLCEVGIFSEVEHNWLPIPLSQSSLLYYFMAASLSLREKKDPGPYRLDTEVLFPSTCDYLTDCTFNRMTFLHEIDKHCFHSTFLPSKEVNLCFLCAKSEDEAIDLFMNFFLEFCNYSGDLFEMIHLNILHYCLSQVLYQLTPIKSPDKPFSFPSPTRIIKRNEARGSPDLLTRGYQLTPIKSPNKPFSFPSPTRIIERNEARGSTDLFRSAQKITDLFRPVEGTSKDDSLSKFSYGSIFAGDYSSPEFSSSFKETTPKSGLSPKLSSSATSERTWNSPRPELQSYQTDIAIGVSQMEIGEPTVTPGRTMKMKWTKFSSPLKMCSTAPALFSLPRLQPARDLTVKSVSAYLETVLSEISPPIDEKSVEDEKLDHLFDRLHGSLRVAYCEQFAKMHTFHWKKENTELPLDQYFTEPSISIGDLSNRYVDGMGSVHMDGIFSSESEEYLPPKRILLIGECGSGKTSLCTKLATDWAKRKSYISHFSLLLFLPRKKHKRKSLSEEILSVAENMHFTQEDIISLFEAHQEKVLLILDGYDEECFKDVSELVCFEDGDDELLASLSEATVLFTCRPEFSQTIKEYFQKELMLKGFSRDQQIEYISKYFGEKDRDDSVESLVKNDAILALCESPVLLQMLCLCQEAGDTVSLPPGSSVSLTSLLYECFLHTVLNKRMETVDHVLDNVNRFQLTTLVNDCLCILGRCYLQLDDTAATENVRTDRFSDCESQEYDLLLRLDLLEKDTSTPSGEDYIPSDTIPEWILEYCAALYLCTVIAFNSAVGQLHRKASSGTISSDVLRQVILFCHGVNRGRGTRMLHELHSVVDTKSISRDLTNNSRFVQNFDTFQVNSFSNLLCAGDLDRNLKKYDNRTEVAYLKGEEHNWPENTDLSSCGYHVLGTNIESKLLYEGITVEKNEKKQIERFTKAVHEGENITYLSGVHISTEKKEVASYDKVLDFKYDVEYIDYKKVIKEAKVTEWYAKKDDLRNSVAYYDGEVTVQGGAIIELYEKKEDRKNELVLFDCKKTTEINRITESYEKKVSDKLGVKYYGGEVVIEENQAVERYKEKWDVNHRLNYYNCVLVIEKDRTEETYDRKWDVMERMNYYNCRKVTESERVLETYEKKVAEDMTTTFIEGTIETTPRGKVERYSEKQVGTNVTYIQGEIITDVNNKTTEKYKMKIDNELGRAFYCGTVMNVDGEVIEWYRKCSEAYNSDCESEDCKPFPNKGD